jgi:hypothetical protein
MVDEDGKSALSAGAVNAARARKRINESFKHLADLCGCSRSKKPSILISAIDKIQRLEATVRYFRSTGIVFDTWTAFIALMTLILETSKQS